MRLGEVSFCEEVRKERGVDGGLNVDRFWGLGLYPHTLHRRVCEYDK